ncbi:MAG: hypothetical protein IKP26_10685 [Clostridia bacterium]|nr:hypothetical protein [Clostridia bacterium]
MNKEKLLKAIGDIDPAFVREAEPGSRKRSALSWALPAAAAFVLTLGLALVLPRVLGEAAPGEASPGEKSAAISTESIDAVPAAGPSAGSGESGYGDIKGNVPSASSTEAPDASEPVRGVWTPDKADPALVTGFLVSEAEDMTLDVKNAGDRALIRDARDKTPQLKGFASKLVSELISENPTSNTVLSPVNLYAALAMVAETSEGETRAEILKLLEADSMEQLRGNVRDLITGQSRNDDHVRCTFADSLWMNNAYGFNTETLENLSKYHGASVFWGDPAEESYTLALREWLNEQTGGLLSDYADDIELDENMLLTLVSTLYFRCSWNDKYNADDTAQRVFHAPCGDIACDFMSKLPVNLSIHMGENFTALGDRLNEGAGTAWFLLPDEGVSIEEMLAQGGMDFMLSEKPRADWETDFITSSTILTIPKLDISSRNDIIPALKKLGVNACFDPEKADFSPLTDEKDVFVNKIEHSARICADEDGVEAAAYTLVQYYGGPHEPQSEYVLDRPFVLMIEGSAGAPLFIGVVNTPNN